MMRTHRVSVAFLFQNYSNNRKYRKGFAVNSVRLFLTFDVTFWSIGSPGAEWWS